MKKTKLVKYNFFSREKGWSCAEYESKYYISKSIYIEKNNIFEGLRGQDIIKLLESNPEKNENLIRLSQIYFDWYLYQSDTKINISTEFYN